MIAQMESGAKQTELTDDCDRFARTMLRLAGAKVTCGIGDVCEDIGGLRDSYSGAREAVSYRVLYGTASWRLRRKRKTIRMSETPDFISF